MSRFFQMDRSGSEAEIVIYGNITSWPWDESDVSSWTLSKAIAELGDDVSEVTVRINSYGGEVAEGIAIFNALRSCGKRVRTICDGFACSIASVIFMAGSERIMNEASLLMIHNAWTCASGDSNDLRKQADDLDAVTELSKKAYLAFIDLPEDELTEWMDEETFISADTALAHGFCTSIEPINADGYSQSAAFAIRERIMAYSDRQESAIESDCETIAEALESEDADNAHREGRENQESDAEAASESNNDDLPLEGDERENPFVQFLQAICK